MSLNSFESLGSTSMDFDEDEEQADLKIGKVFVSTINLVRKG
jgi:hypothetical protein